MYGQCVFETIAVQNAKPCLLDLHITRLLKGANVLGIPADGDTIIDEVTQLSSSVELGIVRINLTMGEGGRGYQNPSSPSPTRIITLHEYPIYPKANWQEGIKIGLADIELAEQPLLAGIKHGNRLEQIIARNQWLPDWQEALLLDTNKHIIEGTQSNVFLVKNKQLITPNLDKAGVAGVMRHCVINEAQKSGLETLKQQVRIEDVEQADEVFLTNSVIGIWPVKQFRETRYNSIQVSTNLLKNIIKNEFIPTI